MPTEVKVIGLIIALICIVQLLVMVIHRYEAKHDLKIKPYDFSDIMEKSKRHAKEQKVH